MARPQRVSEDQILHAARATFLELGSGAPLAVIAKKLGVSTAGLLHRTGSKEALLQRCLAPPFAAPLATLAAGPQPGNARQQLERVLISLHEFLTQQIPRLVVLRTGGHGLKPQGTPPPVLLRKELARWLSQVPTRVSAEVTAEALLGAMEARAFNRHLGGDAFAPGDDAKFLSTLLDALLTEETS